MPQPVEQIVTQPQELAAVCAHLVECRRFGFDTEFVGEDTYQPHLCLIQVATEDRLIVIDPFTAGTLDEFWKVVVSPNHEVVAHAAREEIRLCRRSTRRPPGNLFDTQIAAGLVGLNYPLSFGALAYQTLDVNLAKTETLTEWRERPLSRQQISYAFDDVRYLLPMRQALAERLEKLGRIEWAKEEFGRLVEEASEEPAAAEKWRRLKGIGSLNRRQLAVVRELFQWRDEVAARADRPPRTICRDDLLIEIARRNPTRERDVQSVRGIQRRDVLPILAAVERARALPPDEWPPMPERDIDPPQLALLTSLLSAVLGHLCNEMQLSNSLVATTQDLRLLAREFVCRRPPNGDSLLNEGWRRQHIRPPLEAVLKGDKLLRVANPSGEAPFDLVQFPR